NDDITSMTPILSGVGPGNAVDSQFDTEKLANNGMVVDVHADTVKRHEAEMARKRAHIDKLDEIIKKQSETIEKEVEDYNKLVDEKASLDKKIESAN
uniref:M protein PepM57 (Fragments) n=1 Tax=Streptococcus pyogenes TaxID=1314 RepID=Q7M1B3_STRPY